MFTGSCEYLDKTQTTDWQRFWKPFMAPFERVPITWEDADKNTTSVDKEIERMCLHLETLTSNMTGAGTLLDLYPGGAFHHRCSLDLRQSIITSRSCSEDWH